MQQRCLPALWQRNGFICRHQAHAKNRCVSSTAAEKIHHVRRGISAEIQHEIFAVDYGSCACRRQRISSREFFTRHAQRILLESQLAATEEKLNALKASVADANEKLNTLQANATVANGKLNALQANAAVANRAGVGAEMKQQLAEDQQAVRDAVAGIYEFEPPNL